MSALKNVNDNAIRDEIARQIKAEMIVKKVAVRKMAIITGISVSAVMSYRQGTADIPATKLASIAKALGVSCSVLLGKYA